MGLDGWGNDWADWLDERINYSRNWWQGNPQSWVWNGSVNTACDLASGSADMLRVGNGLGYALYAPDENMYGRGAFIAMDVARGAGLFTLLGGGALRVKTPIENKVQYWKGGGEEKFFGGDLRIAPYGNRTGHPIGEYPHYHRRGPQTGPNESAPGQGIGRHRPWERSTHDRSFWDRF